MQASERGVAADVVATYQVQHLQQLAKPVVRAAAAAGAGRQPLAGAQCANPLPHPITSEAAHPGTAPCACQPPGWHSLCAGRLWCHRQPHWEQWQTWLLPQQRRPLLPVMLQVACGVGAPQLATVALVTAAGLVAGVAAAAPARAQGPAGAPQALVLADLE